MAIQQVSLFIVRLLWRSEGVAACQGIAVPVSPDDRIAIRFDAPITAWMDGFPERTLTWQYEPDPSYEFRESDNDRELNAFAFAVHNFIIKGDISDIGNYVFLNPAQDLNGSTYDYELIMLQTKTYKTSTFQSYLWHNASGFLEYGDFFGKSDDGLATQARERGFLAGDTIPFVVRKGREVAGVALLLEKMPDESMSARLYFPCNSVEPLYECILVSRELTELAEIKATFEVPIACVGKEKRT